MSSSGYVARKIAAASRRSSRPLLPELAARRLQGLRAIQDTKASTERPGLIDYVESLLPDWERFDYFEPYARELESAIGGGLRVGFAAPPQHGKTEFTLRGLLWIARFFPGHRHAYVTYNNNRTRAVAKEFQRIAEAAGFRVSGTLDEVELRSGDGPLTVVKFTSIDGSLTGFTIDGLCIVDDPIKGRKEARSATVRRNTIDWWKSVARTRRHPGTSYIVMATRWPGGDLTDHLTKNEGWKYINLKAIAEPEGPDDLAEDGTVLSDPLGRKAGESLSRRKPPEFFREDRADVFWWVSMFQGQPRSEGMSVFAAPGSFDEQGQPLGPRLYSELPKDGYRVAYGVDLAYSERTSADWSILIEGWEYEGNLYIVDVQRKQVPATSFLLTLIAARTNRPSAPFRFYSGGGGEKGVADFIRQKVGRQFKVLPATSDKLARATAASVSWNLGRVLLPDPKSIKAPWLEDFLAVVLGFTGTPGEQDDDVDALAAVHDQLMRKNRMLAALSGETK